MSNNTRDPDQFVIQINILILFHLLVSNGQEHFSLFFSQFAHFKAPFDLYYLHLKEADRKYLQGLTANIDPEQKCPEGLQYRSRGYYCIQPNSGPRAYRIPLK